MKKMIFATLMLLGAILPINTRAEVTSDTPSVLFWLNFHLNYGSDDDDELRPISSFDLITGKIYTDGQMELIFNNSETIAVSIKLNDAEVSSTEFVPAEGDNSLTFDLDDFGKGAYEINVTMSDGSVQTATFEY